jgi:alpha-L-rhamnosidase
LGPQTEALGTDFLVTAYHAYDLGIIAKVAQILGKSTDAQKYTERYAKRKAFFNTTFVNADKKSLGTTGGGRAFPGRPAKPLEFRVADTQTSYAVGLGMDLFNDENKPYMIRNLAETVSRENKDDAGTVRPVYSLMTGFIGTSWISNALSDNGHSDLAYRILQNAQYPSWLYAIDQGATSIWERLNGYTVDKGFGGNNSMNSFNHYSFGAVGQWMVGNSLGIQRDEPGFKKFILQPEPDPTGTMTFAEGYYDSMYGRISSSWKLNGEILTYRATIPPNTTAILYLPATAHEDVREGGKVAGSANGVRFVKFANGKAVYELQSGNYEFTTNM